MDSKQIFSTQVACIDYEQTLEWANDKACLADSTYAVEAANTHVVTKAHHESDFGEAMSKFDLIVPDGVPLLWALNKKLPAKKKLIDRVYGPELMLRALTSPLSHAKHFFLGGSQETLNILQNKYSRSSKIVGNYSPPFEEWSAQEFETISQKIKASGATFIWVSFGCPKQEFWIAKFKEQLPKGVYFGIGAAFDFLAKTKPQAPRALQKVGCEWLFRLITEPRRLWRRYFIYNTLFIFYTIESFLTESNDN